MGVSDNDSKKYVELESIFLEDKLYVFRADGVDFGEFRVLKLDSSNLKEVSVVMSYVVKEVMSKFDFIEFAFVCDDALNFAFYGKNVTDERRVHKNVSLLAAYISVQFNKYINKSNYSIKLKRENEYYFDGRFVEVDNIECLKYYFLKEQAKSNMYFSNLLRKEGFKWAKNNMAPVLRRELRNKETQHKYFTLAGFYIMMKVNEPIWMCESLRKFRRGITTSIDKQFSKYQ